MSEEVKLEFATKQLSEEQKAKLEADFKKAQENTVLTEVPLRAGEIDIRKLTEADFRQIMFRWMSETEELLVAIAQSSNDALMVAKERLSPKQRERVDKLIDNREQAFKKEAEKALAEKKQN